jgi:hypothetical protein
MAASRDVSQSLLPRRWIGRSDARPSATAQRNGDGTTTVYATWNRAGEVDRWIVRGGAAEGGPLQHMGSVPRDGFEATITLSRDVEVVEVVAEDALGRVIARSPLTPVSS